MKHLLIMVANTLALPLYVLWFGLHESADLAKELRYGWRKAKATPKDGPRSLL